MPAKPKNPRTDEHHLRPGAISVRCGQELYDRYDKAATRLGVKKSDLAILAIEKFVEMVETYGEIPRSAKLIPDVILAPNPTIANQTAGPAKIHRAAG